MGFDIAFDYRFDSDGFFDDRARRAALEAAAALWEAELGDEFADVPAGIAFEVRDPADLGRSVTVELAEPIDDVLIFVAAAPLGGSLGLGGATGLSAGGVSLGDAYARRVSADFRETGPVTDFEPWAGSITFASDAPWSFALDGPEPGRDDFLTTAAHEIGHVLGFGGAPAFAALSEGAVFAGPNALAATAGAGVPLDATAHVVDGYAGDAVLMDPIVIRGTRKGLTDIDRAILADIGYEIAGFERVGTQPPLATEGADGTIFGSRVADRIDALGGDDRLQGAEGDDTLAGGAGADTLFGEAGADRLEGGPGADALIGGPGADTVALAPGGGADVLQDFEPGVDRIEIAAEFGFATPQEVLARIELPFANVSRLVLGEETTLDVFHAPLGATPITAETILIAEPAPRLVEGGDGDDTLTAGPEAERILAGAGDDVILAGPGGDILEGGPGTDRAVYPATSAELAPSLGPDGTVTLSGPAGADTLIGVERIDLADGDYLYDLPRDATLDLCYRLYGAAFGRTPDEGGLRFWLSAIEAGLSQYDAALAFTDNPESRLLYGEDPDDAAFVTALYRNALMREPEPEGLAFWTGAVATGSYDRPEMLIFFADSPENVARAEPFLSDGVFVLAEPLML